MSCIKTVGVIGAGAWGTALAQACARGGLSPVLQAREPEVVEAILTQRENTLFLPGVPLSEAIRPTTDFADLADCDIILAVSPAQNLRAALTQFAPYSRPEQPVLICSKGIERGSLKLMTEVAAETLPTARLAVLSGPSFAAEVARGLPAAVTIACADPCLGQKLAEAISGPGVRPYIVSDLIGAEAGAAVKNVLAIACGVVEGRELGRNAHAALITRGFAEITRMCVALGGDPQTVAGLCGLGDLVLTCSSSQSRNMSVGLALGRGKTLAEALEGKLTVAEGVQSAPAVAQLATKLGIEMPICMAVDAILAGRLSVEHAIGGLLARPLKPEHEPRA